MHSFKGRCLCGMSHFSIELTNFDVYACHCTLCQKWSGGIAMYLEAQGEPCVEQDSIAPSHFSSSTRGERWFCPGCGCPLWFELTSTGRYFVPWTLLEMSEDERRRLVLAAEIYTETQPAFCGMTGQYARLSGAEMEALEARNQFTP